MEYCGYGFIIPVGNISFYTTICGLTEWLIHHRGIPHSVVSDQEMYFTAKEVQQWAHALESTGFTIYLITQMQVA